MSMNGSSCQQIRLATVLLIAIGLLLLEYRHADNIRSIIPYAPTDGPIVLVPSATTEAFIIEEPESTGTSVLADGLWPSVVGVEGESRVGATPNNNSAQETRFRGEIKARVAKVSMLYGASPQPQYVRALDTHRRHNERFGYQMHILQEDALGGYWNKPTYLLSLIMQELIKSPKTRVEWLMWVDADLILLNSLVPLEVFLPPVDLSENVHFIGGRDHNGLNTGTFFIRVSAWSIHMLTKALALPLTRPDVELGNSMDQVAMSVIMSEELVGEPVDSAPCIFQPRIWTNTYEFAHGYEGEEPDNGYLLVHFPGLEQDRWSHMNRWLDEVENEPQKWERELEKSIYMTQVPEYWDLVRKVHRLMNEVDEMLDGYIGNGRLEEQVQSCRELLTGPGYTKISPGSLLLSALRDAVDTLESSLHHN